MRLLPCVPLSPGLGSSDVHGRPQGNPASPAGQEAAQVPRHRQQHLTTALIAPWWHPKFNRRLELNTAASPPALQPPPATSSCSHCKRPTTSDPFLTLCADVLWLLELGGLKPQECFWQSWRGKGKVPNPEPEGQMGSGPSRSIGKVRGIRWAKNWAGREGGAQDRATVLNPLSLSLPGPEPARISVTSPVSPNHLLLFNAQGLPGSQRTKSSGPGICSSHLSRFHL